MTPDREHLELHVPDDDRVPAHPRLVPDPPRRSGCSVLGFLAILAVAMLVAAPNVSAAVLVAEPGSGYGPGQPASSDVSAPTNSGGIGTATYQASATWCAPTRTQCRRWGGHALLAALPTYTGHPYTVRVWFGERHVDVRVVSICGCGIDLSPWAFQQLAPLSVGRIQVEVEGPIAPLPATDAVQ